MTVERLGPADYRATHPDLPNISAWGRDAEEALSRLRTVLVKAGVEVTM